MLCTLLSQWGSFSPGFVQPLGCSFCFTLCVEFFVCLFCLVCCVVCGVLRLPVDDESVYGVPGGLCARGSCLSSVTALCVCVDPSVYQCLPVCLSYVSRIQQKKAAALKKHYYVKKY